MKREEHRPDGWGHCTRCGLSARHGKLCPPGFWMTAFEAKTWDSLPEHERATYERWCVAGKDGED